MARLLFEGVIAYPVRPSEPFLSNYLDPEPCWYHVFKLWPFSEQLTILARTLLISVRVLAPTEWHLKQHYVMWEPR